MANLAADQTVQKRVEVNAPDNPMSGKEVYGLLDKTKDTLGLYGRFTTDMYRKKMQYPIHLIKTLNLFIQKKHS
jgi:hypothetical protein